MEEWKEGAGRGALKRKGEESGRKNWFANSKKKRTPAFGPAEALARYPSTL